MYNRHRVVQWRICKPACPSGVRFSLPHPYFTILFPRLGPTGRTKRSIQKEVINHTPIYVLVYIYPCTLLSPGRVYFLSTAPRLVNPFNVQTREKKPLSHGQGRLFRGTSDKQVERERESFQFERAQFPDCPSRYFLYK